MNKKRPTIAYLTTWFAKNMINNTIWSGIYKTAKQKDTNILCIPGNPPETPLEYDKMANILFKFVTKKRIDGLIVWGSGLSNLSTAVNMDLFYNYFKDFPLVNIGTKRRGIPSIIIDNYNGVYNLCRHLAEDHQCTQIAFIRGPAEHEEAGLRYQAYRDALHDLGIDFNPELVTPGGFTKQSGVESVITLIDKRKKHFDAIISANDLIATGALMELDRRNISIPEDVKIVGFDNMEEGALTRIPLTTVHQPFHEMGISSVYSLLKLMKGGKIDNLTTIPSKEIIRESCGCHPADFIRQQETVQNTGQKDTAAGEKKIILEIINDLGPVADRSFIRKFIKKLLAPDLHQFTDFIYNEVKILKGRSSIEAIKSVVMSTRRILVPFADEKTRDIIENQLIFALIMIKEYSHRLDFTIRQIEEHEIDKLQSLGRKLISSFNLNNLFKILTDEFRNLGIKQCYISLYKDQKHPEKTLMLKLAYNENGPVDLRKKKIVFSPEEFIPRTMLDDTKPFSFIIEPLYFEDEHLGLIAFGEEIKQGPAYTLLQTQLSVSIKGALLIQEKEELLKKLENRAHELQAMMEKLEDSNKELEQFSFIASHDLKEPLRKIQVFSNRLSDKYSDIFDEKGNDLLNRMNKAAERMQMLITNLLEYSRLTIKTSPFKSVDLNLVLEQAKSDLELILEQKKAVIKCEHLPTVEGDPDQLKQLFQNLISNALKFQKKNTIPEITVSYTKTRESGKYYYKIIFSDNGIGMEEKYSDSIFGVFQRLHSKSEYEGTGIGLAICKKVVDRHNGRIQVESKPDTGSDFIICLPRNQSDSNT